MNSFFDLQVNGYAGIDFNGDGLRPPDLHFACQRLKADGVKGILATIITDDLKKMCERLSRLAVCRGKDPLVRRMIAGFHIEGPFINENPGYRGAHPLKAIHPARLEEMKRLLEAADGLARMVTLAPERDPGLKVTRFLVNRKVIISAGHSNASLNQLRAAIDAGISMYTHLGNGCPMMMERHDNIIQRVFSLSDRLILCFIADGAHIPFWTLKNYLGRIDLRQCIVVTDAVAPAGLGPGKYTLGRLRLNVGPDLVAWAPDKSHLMGAVVTMKQSFENLVRRVGLTVEKARLLTMQNPRRALLVWR